ncbi:hypothetical protein BU23DRAFT_549090 [Bimuria novae-zelandiae CBS 107.79]|uniref:Uncharacterized protein n=1 Tax=Bimuria novae-zelandiae CBS 107.79 TaxID=1447943 RepID=A0A6A5VQF1_9PLEO|nr:hypothetical protein BU23DRAFT_549090 [Bimuria novae-zelandiae CBS 107.79]
MVGSSSLTERSPRAFYVFPAKFTKKRWPYCMSKWMRLSASQCDSSLHRTRARKSWWARPMSEVFQRPEIAATSDTLSAPTLRFARKLARRYITSCFEAHIANPGQYPATIEIACHLASEIEGAKIAEWLGTYYSIIFMICIVRLLHKYFSSPALCAHRSELVQRKRRNWMKRYAGSILGTRKKRRR